MSNNDRSSGDKQQRHADKAPLGDGGDGSRLGNKKQAGVLVVVVIVWPRKSADIVAAGIQLPTVRCIIVPRADYDLNTPVVVNVFQRW